MLQELAGNLIIWLANAKEIIQKLAGDLIIWLTNAKEFIMWAACSPSVREFALWAIAMLGNAIVLGYLMAIVVLVIENSIKEWFHERRNRKHTPRLLQKTVETQTCYIPDRKAQ